MAKRALGWFLVAAGLWACSAGGESASEASPPGNAPADPASSVERDIEPVARFQFVSTAQGMAVEAVSESQVTTFACPTRSCTGLCDECAARACQAAGELSEACNFLVSRCNETCGCGTATGDNPSCGFPVCTLGSKICYVGDEADEPGLGPNAPRDPSPSDFAGRPSESSSNASRPAY